MNASTSARSSKTREWRETGSPQDASTSYTWLCEVMLASRSIRSTGHAPTPCTSMRSRRRRSCISASRSGFLPSSFCRSDPLAALRGLANTRSPLAACAAFSSSNDATGKKISPRTSTVSGCGPPASRSGTEPIARTLTVTSSPVMPSPRVAAEASTPRS